jgi:hypothetical protein
MLLKGCRDPVALGLCEGRDRVSLGFKAQAALGLSLRAYPDIGDGLKW